VNLRVKYCQDYINEVGNEAMLDLLTKIDSGLDLSLKLLFDKINGLKNEFLVGKQNLNKNLK
jgi:hypothetical protein